MPQSNSSCLEFLPNELMDIILNFCDPEAMISLALTGPILYSFIKSQEARLSARVVGRTINKELMQLAIARRCAEAAGWRAHGYKDTPDQTSRQVNEFIDRFLIGADNDLENRTLGWAYNLCSFHEAVLNYAHVLSQRAVTRGPRRFAPDATFPRAIMTVTEGEFARFCRALYIHQIYCGIFPVQTSNDGGLKQVMKRLQMKFSPWENQQVRCIHFMLRDHFKRRKLNCSSLNLRLANCSPEFVANEMENGTEQWLPNLDFLPKFVVSQNLRVMMRHEINGSIKNYIMGMESQNRDFEHYRSQVPFRCRDKDWLLQIREQGTIRLTIHQILSRYEDTDTGPQEAWLHTLLDGLFGLNEEDGPDDEEDEELRLCCMFCCERCMTHWGFVFWDRDKLLWHSHWYMPTLEEMVDGSEGLQVDYRNYKDAISCREDGICLFDDEYD